MNIKLKKSEIKALRQLCTRDDSIAQLSAKLEAKPSFTSRVLDGLKKKGLVEFSKTGAMKIVRLSSASHAQYFKLLSDSRPQASIEEWLSGYAMEILIASLEGANTGLILKESGCTPATLYKTLRALISVGAVFWKEGQVRISDPLLSDFVVSYADNLDLLVLREVRGHNYALRVRKRVVIRTDAENVPDFFTKTGVSALAENGLEALLTSYNDYCFDLDQQRRPVSLEEAFIHALLVTTRQHRQDMTVLAIFYAKNHRHLNFRALVNFAKIYNVENALDEVRGKTGFYEKMKDMER